jgi:uncharacterized protein (TIGR03435 family)
VPESQRKFTAVATSLVILATSLMVSPAAQGPKPTFEVASVKRSQSVRQDWSQNIQPGGRFIATNVSLVNLIQYAYFIRDYQVDQVPSWVRTERFDVVAKAEREVPQEQVHLMLQSLLEDRFHLVVRRDEREMRISALVLARSDGRLGPNLVKVSGPDDCKAAMAQHREVPPGAMMSRGCGGVSLVAGMASTRIGATVVDRTGLSGTWDILVYYAPDIQTHADTSLPSFVTALTEQLGLKLQPGRGPVGVLVIESVQRPAED